MIVKSNLLRDLFTATMISRCQQFDLIYEATSFADSDLCLGLTSGSLLIRLFFAAYFPHFLALPFLSIIYPSYSMYSTCTFYPHYLTFLIYHKL